MITFLINFKKYFFESIDKTRVEKILKKLKKFLKKVLTNFKFGTIIINVLRRETKTSCRCSSMVEPQPSKLMTWVRFPLPAPKIETNDNSFVFILS